MLRVPSDPNVVLTAGHCTSDFFFPVASARIYLQQNAMANPAQSGFPNTCAAGTLGVSCATSSQLFDYSYAPPWREFPDIRDVGLLILDQPLVLSEYGVLASAGYLDTLARRRGQRDHTFTISGYGLLKRGPTGAVASLERMMALSKLTSLTNHLTGGFGLQLVGNGACRGDSGGPVLH